MEKTLLFVYNPSAGKGKVAGKLSSIIYKFTQNGYKVTVHPTLRRLDGYEYIKEHGREYDAVVCSGGDGTLNETISGFIEGGVEVPLGYIPGGSANDTALTLKIPLDPEKSADTAINGIPFPFDIGRFNERYFVYVAAFGAFSEVSYSTPQDMKNALGHTAYIIEAIKRLPRIRSYKMRVEADGQVFEDTFLFGAVCNTLSVGGGVLKFSSEYESLYDGELEVLLLRDSKSLIDVGHIALCLLNQDYSDENIVFFKTKHLTITAEDDVPWTFDGEDGGAHSKAEITCVESPVRIMSGVK